MKLNGLHILEARHAQVIRAIYEEGEIGGTKYKGKIAQAIDSSGMSRAEVADQVGVDKSTITRISAPESAGSRSRKPSIELLAKLKKVIGPAVVNAILSVIGYSDDKDTSESEEGHEE